MFVFFCLSPIISHLAVLSVSCFLSHLLQIVMCFYLFSHFLPFIVCCLSLSLFLICFNIFIYLILHYLAFLINILLLCELIACADLYYLFHNNIEKGYFLKQFYVTLNQSKKHFRGKLYVYDRYLFVPDLF